MPDGQSVALGMPHLRLSPKLALNLLENQIPLMLALETAGFRHPVALSTIGRGKLKATWNISFLSDPTGSDHIQEGIDPIAARLHVTGIILEHISESPNTQVFPPCPSQAERYVGVREYLWDLTSADGDRDLT
jgi:hypothetical protein